jgi:uncharacterized protein (TIGR00369 family)
VGEAGVGADGAGAAAQRDGGAAQADGAAAGADGAAAQPDGAAAGADGAAAQPDGAAAGADGAAAQPDGAAAGADGAAARAGNGGAAVRERRYAWTDPTETALLARTTSGLELLRRVLRGELPPPPIADTLGFRLSEAEAGRVVFTAEPHAWQYNPIGSVHGGMLATVLDSAAGCAVHSRLPAGTAYTSLDLTVRFLCPVTVDTGSLRCTGEVVSMGRRTAFAQTSLTDSAGRLLAHATSTCLLFSVEDG